MIKGWRNDPQWVAHYAARDKARLERELIRMKWESDMRIQQMQDSMKPYFPKLKSL